MTCAATKLAAYKYAHAHSTTTTPQQEAPHTHPASKVDRQTELNSGVVNHRRRTQFSSSIITGMQSNEGTVMFSIALLQQRFRELERIKEKREERLLQMLTPRAADLLHGGGGNAAAPREAPVRWFFHPELLYPCRPLRGTATLFPVVPGTTACECKTIQLRGDSLAVDLWPSKAYKHVSSEVDVDTSLHL